MRWTGALSQYFPAGYTTDDGWNFELYRSAGVDVGDDRHVARRDTAPALRGRRLCGSRHAAPPTPVAGGTVGNRSVVAEAGVLVAFDRSPA